MTGTKHFLNLNYVCNERCVFCASDLTNAPHTPKAARQVPLRATLNWLEDGPVVAGDRVMLAGGEPTLHPQLTAIASAAAEAGAEVTLFTNGLRLADPAFARRAVSSGIGRFEIALFGATAKVHESVTQVPGSFARTVTALGNLGTLRASTDFRIQVRLLVSRHSYREGPAIVDLVHRDAPRVDEISLNRLILSEHARGVAAAVSWPEARGAINEAARRAIALGYELEGTAIPICIFDPDVAAYVAGQLARQAARVAQGAEPQRWKFRYYDPYVAADLPGGTSSRVPLAMPDPCIDCPLVNACGRVEAWYVARFGTEGLGLQVHR